MLCNAFVTPALPRILAALPLGVLTRLQVPEWVLSRWMLGSYANGERIAALREAIGAVQARVLASRMRICLTLDERGTLARTRVPVLDLRGRHDRLVAPERHRRVVLASRPDAATADVDAPHVMLLTEAAQVWATISGRRSSKRRPQP